MLTRGCQLDPSFSKAASTLQIRRANCNLSFILYIPTTWHFKFAKLRPIWNSQSSNWHTLKLTHEKCEGISHLPIRTMMSKKGGKSACHYRKWVLYEPPENDLFLSLQHNDTISGWAFLLSNHFHDLFLTHKKKAKLFPESSLQQPSSLFLVLWAVQCRESSKVLFIIL